MLFQAALESPIGTVVGTAYIMLRSYTSKDILLTIAAQDFIHVTVVDPQLALGSHILYLKTFPTARLALDVVALGAVVLDRVLRLHLVYVAVCASRTRDLRVASHLASVIVNLTRLLLSRYGSSPRPLISDGR